VRSTSDAPSNPGETVMRRYLLEVVAGRDLDVLDELVHEDMTDHTAVAAGWGDGRPGLERHLAYFHRALGDVEVEIERLIASGDEVVAIWRVRGTHTGELFGVQATGRRLSYRNVSVFTLRDGKVADYTGVWDGLAAVGQMTRPDR